MVLLKCEYLHETPLTSYHEELDIVNDVTSIIIKEVERWQAILSVNYANFNLENNEAHNHFY